MANKLIKIKDLIPGMYINEINCSLKDRDAIGETRNFLVLSKAEIDRIAAFGVRELYINPEKGLDHYDEDEERKKANLAIAELARLRNGQNQEPKTLEDELYEARLLIRKARNELENAIKSIQAGEKINFGTVRPLLEEIFKSVNENKDAIVTVCRKKQKDGYSVEHSVSHCALMMAFGQSLEMDKESLLDLGLGGLFHDIGKVKIPAEVLNKPGKLTPQEMGAVKKHPLWGALLLKDSDPAFPERALSVVTEHHERLDGTGYPYQLKEHGISLFGQMASIVDVFDASTSIRPYGLATDPCLAIKGLFEGAGTLFHKELVQQFIKMIGIYPVGTLARLESNKLGIVIRQTKSLSKPVVRIVYNLKHNGFLPPQDVDLSRIVGKEDKVVASESPEKWKIDPFRYILPELVSVRAA